MTARRLLLLTLLTLGCQPTARGPVRLGRWPDGTLVEVRAAESLSACQTAALAAAVAWWESTARRRLFVVRSVPDTDPALNGLPQPGVVSVTSTGKTLPYSLGETRLNYRGATCTLIHSAEVTVPGCSPRVFAHELGHALGLGHSPARGALMALVHDGDAWAIEPGELASVHP